MRKTITRENGAILIGELPEKRGGKASVDILIVPPDSRREGIGAKLLEEFEISAREVRASRIDTIFAYAVTTGSDRVSLIALFEKQGYQRENDFGFGPLYFKNLSKKRKRK